MQQIALISVWHRMARYTAIELDRESQVAASSFAAGMRADQIAVLAQRAEYRSFAKGQSILSRSDQSFPIMVLLEGSAEVLGLVGQEVNLIKAGAMIGEVSFLDRQTRTADVSAKDDCVLAVFSEDLIAWLNMEHPDIVAQLLFNVGRALCVKLRWAQRIIDASDSMALLPAT